jgi:uncharacterized protein (DUF2384 family)
MYFYTMSSPEHILQEPAAAYLAFQESYYELAGQAIAKTYIKEILSLTQIPLNEFIQLIPISIDTYKRKAIFNPAVTEKVLQIEEVYRKGLAAFGEGFYNWVAAPNSSLGGEAPKTLLSNSFGVRKLLTLIGRMEHGVLT